MSENIETKRRGLVRRSTLIVPVTNEKFVAKAHTRGADAVILDLEDSIPIMQKGAARKMLASAVKMVGQGNIEVLVRINNSPAFLEEDVRAAVIPGVSGLVLPKTESVEEIRYLDQLIAKEESSKGLAGQSITLSVAIETARGLANARELLLASRRIVATWLGTEDFCRDMEIEPTDSGDELLFFKLQLLMAARLTGVQPMGIIGKISSYKSLDVLAADATRSYRLGFKGSNCIHPDQVSVLNRCFSPDPEKLSWAQEVVDAFSTAQSKEIGAISVRGKMVDFPVVERARALLGRAKEIQAKEAGALMDKKIYPENGGCGYEQ